MQHMKHLNIRGSHKMVSHITIESLTWAEILLMPVHVDAHWALLVCQLKDHVWEFYDSLSDGRHRVGLKDKVFELIFITLSQLYIKFCNANVILFLLADHDLS